uniref:NADH-ubiquinone oxidoreductase chain 5 n=1 Tax=Cubaia aphrodite TaxID=1104540 RepID=G9ISN4_CUBAP|nr:NADH dehydrogenase subunit 5 [Cubaia aphrodite]AER54533.1 NADH dehydrogenase subunit 5 [Cubaia aphrodite]
MYSLVVILPLISAIIVGGKGRSLGEKGSAILSTTLLVFTWIIAIVLFLEIQLENSCLDLPLWVWFDLGFLYNPLGFYFDEITVSMLVVVSSISTLVHLYSTSYMAGDPHLPRFMSYLSLFTFFMLVLVTSTNLVQLFIGWEGVGLCSYLLINFWFTRIQANKAAIKAMVVNRVGDVGLILAMILTWSYFGSLEFSVIFSSLNHLPINTDIYFWLCFCLLIGAVGKSAQLGLHTWLPDAMEGPTPVSALIHAATMVTAGVFLVIRMSPLFELSEQGLLLTALIGSLTAFFAATIGLAQNDVKKVIAYSTCSQLGYMILICGLSHYNTGLFHLFNHAFFKALLFLSAGSIIHALLDEQDMRRMGALQKITPFSALSILIGSLSLMGLPFLTGFYSKDLILELAKDKQIWMFAFWLGLSAAVLTAYYSFRLIFWTFLQYPTVSRQTWQKAHEGNWNLWTPLLILLITSLSIGYLFQSTILKDLPSPMITTSIKWLPTILSLTGALAALTIYHFFKKTWFFTQTSLYQIIYSFLNAAWQFNLVFNHFLVKPIWSIGLNITYNQIDRQLLEKQGPEGLYQVLTKTASNSSWYQAGWLMNYLLIFLVFVTLYSYLW